jgi:zinc and cadmium transporter
MDALYLSIVAAVAALLGGWAAIRGRKQIVYMLGLTAGIILGLVAFDLLPEIFRIVNSTGLDPKWPMIAFTAGFLVLHIVEKTILLHQPQEDNYGPHVHPYAGVAGAIALIGHSFLDGVAIGVAYQVNSTVGLTVAIAVIAHRFADGFSTANVMLLHKNSRSHAKAALYAAAVMPIIGVLVTNVFTISEKSLAIYLGFFAGFLLYIGASDILPQAHTKGSSRLTILLTICGVAFMFLVTRFV